MMFSLVPTELGAKLDNRYTTTNETVTLPFDETFYYESAHSVFAQPEEIMNTGAFASGWSWAACETIQYFASSDWDCTDLDDSNDICPDGWITYGCYLEYDEYTLDIEFVYDYKIRHFGSATYDIETIWSTNSVPSTTVTMVSTTEDYIMSAKAQIEIEVKRTFVGPNTNSGTLRNTFDVSLPFVSPYDIDGGGNMMSIGGYSLYLWDDYVTFFDEAGEWSNAFGPTGIDVDGSVTIASIDILELACEWLEDNYGFTSSLTLVCKAFNYLIEVNLAIELDFEVDIKTWAQTYLATDSISSISSTYSSPSARVGYQNWLSQPGTQFTTNVPGSGSDINGVMGLYHSIETEESYSTSIYIEPTNNLGAGTLWNYAMGTANYYQIPLSSGLLPSNSAGYESILTNADFTVDAPSGSSSSGGNTNSPPEAVISFDSTSQSYIQIETGDTITLTTEGSYDVDGDTLYWGINWGDGSTDFGSSPPDYTPSHTYMSAGTYTIYSGVNDGIDNSYPSSLTVVVSERTISINHNIEIYPNTVAYAGDLITLSFTLSSDETDLTYCLWDGNSNTYYDCIESSDGDLDYEFGTNYEEGEFTPAIHVYNSGDFLSSYTSNDVIRIIPDISNDNLDNLNFEITGNQILIVIDDNGAEINASRIPEYNMNSNNSHTVLFETIETVSRINNIDFDVLFVGDSDWDNIVDTYNADGPGLNFLSDYSTVVWTTGNSYIPVTEQDKQVLRYYIDAGGSLVMFSQDLLWGESWTSCNNLCTTWGEGTFAHDVFGVSSSRQDMGGPVGNLSALSGDGRYNIQYLPLAGLDNVENSDANNPWQDHISKISPGVPMTESFENFTVDENILTDVENISIIKGEWNYYSTASHGWYSLSSGVSQEDGETRIFTIEVDDYSNFTSVSFDLNVSSELGYDLLKFYVDGIEQGSWSGNIPWQQVSFNISKGSHTLIWSYEKDSSVSIGADQAWIDNITFCCSNEIDSNYALDIFGDEEGNNFAVVKMHQGGGRAALYTMDPVQIDYKFDLESMFLQFIDWSQNEWNSFIQPISLPVGADARHPAPFGGGVTQFQSRLFEGQNVRFSSYFNWLACSAWEIQYLDIELPNGQFLSGIVDESWINQTDSDVGSPDWWYERCSEGKYIDFQVPETGIYNIYVYVNNHTGWTDEAPWFNLRVTDLLDENSLLNGWEYATPIITDGVPVDDVLAGHGWATQLGGSWFDYSDSVFLTEVLSESEMYGIDIVSETDNLNLQIIMVHNEIEKIYDIAINDDDEYTLIFTPNFTSEYEIIIINTVTGYKNPHIDTYKYSIAIWSIPDCNPGSYRDSTELTECIEASPGTYVLDKNSTSETECSIGTFQPSSGQTSCITASLGYFVNEEGAISQIPAPFDEYVNSLGSSSSIKCPENHLTLQIASTSINDCHLDSDGDRNPDYLDDDDDNDGVNDDIDQFPLDSSESGDNDGDGIGDNADFDDDNDGVNDDIDQFPLDSSESKDTDGDGIGDNADFDDDNDEVNDNADQFPLDSSEYKDTDGDGIGDNADSDDDNDGFSDLDEIECETSILISVSFPSDFDGDGICDRLDLDNTDGPLYVSEEGNNTPGFSTIATILIIISTSLIVKFRRIEIEQ